MIWPPNFARSELVFSRAGEPDEEQEANLNRVAWRLQAFRDWLSEQAGKDAPIRVTSGFRSESYNASIKGADKSYHTRGLAVDLAPPLGLDSPGFLRAWLAFGEGGLAEAIAYTPDQGGHIHLAWKEDAKADNVTPAYLAWKGKDGYHKLTPEGLKLLSWGGKTTTTTNKGGNSGGLLALGVILALSL